MVDLITSHTTFRTSGFLVLLRKLSQLPGYVAFSFFMLKTWICLHFIWWYHNRPGEQWFKKMYFWATYYKADMMISSHHAIYVGKSLNYEDMFCLMFLCEPQSCCQKYHFDINVLSWLLALSVVFSLLSAMTSFLTNIGIFCDLMRLGAHVVTL